MAKILLTGMTAPQVSRKAHAKSLSFAGVLNDVLTNMGHDVTWDEPELSSMDIAFRQYDAVIVGLAPITSLSANRAYGALSIINTLWSTDKLFMFIDAPTVSQIGVSLKATLTTPENLIKDFFSYRKGYAEVKNSPAYQSIMMSAINKLMSEDWPPTFYSALPWSKDSDVYASLPETVGNCLVPVHVDTFLLDSDLVLGEASSDKWVYDLPTPHWTKKQLKMVRFPGSPMKMTKGDTDIDVVRQISRSVGALISSDKRQGTWWTSRYSQALNAKTPVVTEWTESSVLGAPWAVLAASIEELTPEQRTQLAVEQKNAYIAALPAKIEVTKTLNETMKL